jgi:excisionase family DNA binding protein
MADVQQTHYSVEQLAAKWSVDERTVRRAIWRGELKGVRFGRAIRVPLAEVERYERSRPAA